MSTNNNIQAIESTITNWKEDTAAHMQHRGITLVMLRNLLYKCLSVIKTEFERDLDPIVTAEIDFTIQQIHGHIGNYGDQGAFNVCVTNSLELYRTLHAHGYISERISRVISRSLKNRNAAKQALEETLRINAEAKSTSESIEKSKLAIDDFYEKCFGEDESSFSNLSSKIETTYFEVCGEDGYKESIAAAKDEVEAIKNAAIEFKVELLDGTNEEDSIKDQIAGIHQEILINQKLIRNFVREYIAGETTTRKEGDEEVISQTKSKKDLIDELHASFTKHIETEKENIATYISAFDKYKKETMEEIEGLLKSATNASLASAFEASRDQTKELKNEAEKYFFWSLLALVVAIALPHIPHVKAYFDSGDIYIDMLKRFVMTGPFVWLAYHQSRKSNQYFRLEQEYAHKAVVARSFEGYKAQVLAIYKDNPASKELLNKLINGSIETIAMNPATVLDSVKATKHPIHEVKDQVKELIEPLSKLIDSAKK
jgi:hypothetical protein